MCVCVCIFFVCVWMNVCVNECMHMTMYYIYIYTCVCVCVCVCACVVIYLFVCYLFEYFKWGLMCTILIVIFQTFVFICIVVSCNTTFRPLYPPAFLMCPCLYGHRNDSTWEIIFQIWLICIKLSSPPPRHLSVVAIKKGAFWSPSTKGRQLYLLYICVYLYMCVWIYEHMYVFAYELFFDALLVFFVNGISTFVGYLMPKS